MAVFVNDTFTDTDAVLLQNHTGETGATWTEHPDVLGTDATIQTNKAQHFATATAVAYYASGAPATAEYDVEFTTGSLSSATLGMGSQGRLLTTAYTGYLAWAAGALYLYKHVSGTFTEIGTYAGAVASGTVVKLQILDATKKVFLGGVERISSANNDVTGAGKAGARFYGDGANAIVDTFSATDAAGGGISAALTGQSVPVATGSLTAAITAPLTGQAIPIGQGTVTVATGVSAALTGQSVGVSLGSFSAAITAPLTGQSIPLSLGTMVPAFERAITGQGVTVSVGGVVAAIAPALSGQSVTVSVGSVVVVGGSVSRALSGQGLTVSLGTISTIWTANTTTSGTWTDKTLSSSVWTDKALSGGTWTNI